MSTSFVAKVPLHTLADYSDETVVCKLCEGIFYAPVESNCQHVFCRRCLLTHLLNSSNCPLCSSSISSFNELSRENPLYKNLSALILSCPNRRQGCHKEVPFPDLNLHLAKCIANASSSPSHSRNHTHPIDTSPQRALPKVENPFAEVDYAKILSLFDDSHKINLKLEEELAQLVFEQQQSYLYKLNLFEGLMQKNRGDILCLSSNSAAENLLRVQILENEYNNLMKDYLHQREVISVLQRETQCLYNTFRIHKNNTHIFSSDVLSESAPRSDSFYNSGALPSEYFASKLLNGNTMKNLALQRQMLNPDGAALGIIHRDSETKKVEGKLDAKMEAKSENMEMKGETNWEKQEEKSQEKSLQMLNTIKIDICTHSIAECCGESECKVVLVGGEMEGNGEEKKEEKNMIENLIDYVVATPCVPIGSSPLIMPGEELQLENLPFFSTGDNNKTLDASRKSSGDEAGLNEQCEGLQLEMDALLLPLHRTVTPISPLSTTVTPLSSNVTAVSTECIKSPQRLLFDNGKYNNLSTIVRNSCDIEFSPSLLVRSNSSNEKPIREYDLLDTPDETAISLANSSGTIMILFPMTSLLLIQRLLSSFPKEKETFSLEGRIIRACQFGLNSDVCESLFSGTSIDRLSSSSNSREYAILLYATIENNSNTANTPSFHNRYIISPLLRSVTAKITRVLLNSFAKMSSNSCSLHILVSGRRALSLIGCEGAVHNSLVKTTKCCFDLVSNQVVYGHSTTESAKKNRILFSTSGAISLMSARNEPNTFAVVRIEALYTQLNYTNKEAIERRTTLILACYAALGGRCTEELAKEAWAVTTGGVPVNRGIASAVAIGKLHDNSNSNGGTSCKGASGEIITTSVMDRMIWCSYNAATNTSKKLLEKLVQEFLPPGGSIKRIECRVSYTFLEMDSVRSATMLLCLASSRIHNIGPFRVILRSHWQSDILATLTNLCEKKTQKEMEKILDSFEKGEIAIEIGAAQRKHVEDTSRHLPNSHQSYNHVTASTTSIPSTWSQGGVGINSSSSSAINKQLLNSNAQEFTLGDIQASGNFSLADAIKTSKTKK